MVSPSGALGSPRVPLTVSTRGRRVKRTGRAFSVESERIAESSAQIETHMDRADASNARLGDAAARLATSRARLEVQLQAIREARHTMRRLLWFLPGV